MKFTKLAATLLCSVVLLCGCTKSSDVVLKVNDSEITRGEFYGDFDKFKNTQLKQMKEADSDEVNFITLNLKQRFTEDTIIRALLQKEFEKRNIEATDVEINAKKEFFENRLGSKEELQRILKESNISEERFTQDMANEVKIDKLARQIASVTIGDKEVADFYNQNKDQFKIGATVHAYHILFNTNPDEIKRTIVDADKNGELTAATIDAKVKEEIAKQDKLFNEVTAKAKKNPKDFEKLAKEYSQDPGTKDKGGDLGYIQRENVVKEFGDVAFSQKKGSVATAKSQFGQHIIYVVDKKEEGARPLDEVKDELQAYLEQQTKNNDIKNLVESLKKEAKIEYVDESLNPEELQKQIDEAQKKLIEAQQRKIIPESKAKVLDKMKKEEKSKQETK